MSGKVVRSTIAVDALGGTPRVQSSEVRPVRAVDAVEQTEQADLRLIIEEAGEEGQLMYTLMDRRTGRIVSQRPREDVLRLKDEPDYAAGNLFSGKV